MDINYQFSLSFGGSLFVRRASSFFAKFVQITMNGDIQYLCILYFYGKNIIPYITYMYK